MSIASQIEDYADGLTAAYGIVSQRGGAIPAQKNMNNLATAIATIPSGGGGFTGIYRDSVNGKYIPPTAPFTFTIPSDVTEVPDFMAYSAFNAISPYVPGLTSVTFPTSAWTAGRYAFQRAFYGCTNLTSASLAKLTSTGDYAFDNAFRNTKITNIDLSSLTTAGYYAFNNAFNGCTLATSADIGSLVNAPNAYSFSLAFNNCSSLSTINFNSLSSVTGTYSFNCAFYGTGLVSVSFPNLRTVTGNQCFGDAFGECSALTSLSFPALTSSSFGSYTNQFSRMLYRCSNVTVHFPAIAQAKIETLSSYPNFGGTNTTVLFDL